MRKKSDPVYAGAPPGACDGCHKPLNSTYIDGKTKDGIWGNFDLSCARILGVTLGRGRGQMYRKQDDGSWLKTEG